MLKISEMKTLLGRQGIAKWIIKNNHNVKLSLITSNSPKYREIVVGNSVVVIGVDSVDTLPASMV